MVLDVARGNTFDGSNIGAFSRNNGQNQKFNLHKQ
jgi:hypothetical protein